MLISSLDGLQKLLPWNRYDHSFNPRLGFTGRPVLVAKSFSSSNAVRTERGIGAICDMRYLTPSYSGTLDKRLKFPSRDPNEAGKANSAVLLPGAEIQVKARGRRADTRHPREDRHRDHCMQDSGTPRC
jgi:hypothetical protein